MVFHAERKLESSSIDNNNELGPGQYHLYSFPKKVSENKKPFLTSSPRSLIDIKDTPGPGAYYYDDTHLNVLKNLQREKISRQNDRVNLLTKEGQGLLYKVKFLINSEKKGFNIKSKRFKIINNRDNPPGPGQYFSEDKNAKKKNLKNLKESKNSSNKKINIKQKSEFQRIPTIPEKNCIFGFDILDNGTIVKKQNPDMYRTFTGEKGDTVGPGSYDIEKPNNWLKTGTSWSKLRSVRDCNKNNINNDFSTSATTTNFSESKKNNSNKVSSKTSQRYSKDFDDMNFLELNDLDNINSLKFNDIRKRNKKNLFNLVVANCRMNNRKKCKTQKTFEYLIKNVTPGPGYYITNRDNTSFRVKLVPEYKQFFGSKLSRFSDINNNYINSLGPGEYFKQKNETIQKMNKTTSLGASPPPFLSKVERFKKSEEKKNLIGPGDYTPEFNLEKTKIKNNISSFDGNFGSNELRFYDINLKWKKTIPGPGFYDSEKNMQYIFNKKGQKNKKTGKIYNSTKLDLERLDSIKVNNLVKDENKDGEVPPLGTYNPDIINSIDYKIKKRAYESRNNNIAFTTTFYRKKKKKNNIEVNCENSNLGPGYYYHDKKIIDTRLSPAFHLPEFKRNLNTNMNTIVGPGKYNIDSYNEWSKKSFNINYV